MFLKSVVSRFGIIHKLDDLFKRLPQNNRWGFRVKQYNSNVGKSKVFQWFLKSYKNTSPTVHFSFIRKNDFSPTARRVNRKGLLEGLLDIWRPNSFGIIRHVDRAFGRTALVGRVGHFEVLVVRNLGGFVGNKPRKWDLNRRESPTSVYSRRVDFLVLPWSVVPEAQLWKNEKNSNDSSSRWNIWRGKIDEIKWNLVRSRATYLASQKSQKHEREKNVSFFVRRKITWNGKVALA